MKSFDLTFEEYYLGQRLILSKRNKISYGVIVGFLVLLLIYEFWFFSWSNKTSKITVVYLVMVFVIGYLVRFINKKNIKEIFKIYQKQSKNSQIDFNKQGVEWKSDSGLNKLKWEDIESYRIEKGIILLYIGKTIAHIIPERIFNEKEKAEFLSYLSKVKD